MKQWAKNSQLGLLIGLVESIAIVQWSWLMDDFSFARVATGAAWGMLILVVTAGLWGGFELACRNKRLVAVAVFLLLVFVGRWWVGDRFITASLFVIPAALALAWWNKRPVQGLLAALLAMPALWGRVPDIKASPEEHLVILAPALMLAIIIGAVPWKRAIFVGAPLAVLLGLGGIAVVRGPTRAPPATGPNLLFVLVDTLRRDHIEPYGNGASTPSFVRLSREGVLFDDAITVIPKTTQSVAAFFTGRYPVSNGVRKLKSGLRERETTLAEVLRDAGYDTAAFVHNGWIRRGIGFEQGFEQFWSWYEVERPLGLLSRIGFVTAIDGLTLKLAEKFNANTNARVLTDRALEWLNKERDRPFFAYLHYFDPHWPYRPPNEDGECLVNNIADSEISRGDMIFNNNLPDHENQRARELYKGEVVHNADAVTPLLDWLDEAGMTHDTIVVFTADHGHHLGDHDYFYHHGELLYEPGVQIPLVIRWPKKLEAGKVVPHQVRSIDLMPTLLDLMEIHINGEPRMDGAPALAGPVGPAFLETDISYFKANKRRYVSGNVGKVRGVRTEQWKLIHTPRKGGGLWELYDLQTDGGELENLVAKGTAPPEVIASLTKELGRWLPAKERTALERMGDRFDGLAPAGPLPSSVGSTTHSAANKTDTDTPDVANESEELTEDDQDMLRALGYVN